MTYDQWKAREPDAYEVDLDTEISDVEYEEAMRRGHDRDRCVLGASCLNADPEHASAECFTADLLEGYEQ